MAANVAVAFSLLMTLLGSVLSPETFILPSYFALGFPIIIGLNIGFVIFWMLARKWFFILSLSLLLFSTSQLNDTFPFHLGKTKTVKASHPVSILTYNTMMSGKLVKHTEKKPNMVLQHILDTDADIVCLQEFEVSTQDIYVTHADMLRIFAKYPYKHIWYKQMTSDKKFGLATFSKYPIVNKQHIDYPSESNSSIFSDIVVEGTTIRVINNHLESNRLTEKDKSMPERLKNKFSAENLSGITRHFSRKLGVAYKLRAHQAETVAGIIADSPHKVIVCSDLNDVPTSYAYTLVKGKLKDAFSEIGTGFGWTFCQRFYRFRIDYVFYDPAFSAIKFIINPVKYSDHYPVLCYLKIKAE